MNKLRISGGVFVGDDVSVLCAHVFYVCGGGGDGVLWCKLCKRFLVFKRFALAERERAVYFCIHHESS